MRAAVRGRGRLAIVARWTFAKGYLGRVTDDGRASIRRWDGTPNIYTDSGGGLFCDDNFGCAPILVNCAIWGNKSTWGGGAYFSRTNFARIFNSTISGNAAQGGGGIHCGDDSEPLLMNCIVWANFPDSSCGQMLHGTVDQDPLFARQGIFDFERTMSFNDSGLWSDLLPDFIVEVPDFHLQTNSPAVDTGTSEGAPTFDIEGDGRPCGAGVDMGAYESGDCDPPREHFRRGDVDGNGELELTDAIKALTFQFVGEGNIDCLDTVDVDDDGELTLTDAIRSLSYQFTGTASAPEPPGPFECGIDPTIDDLTCASYPCPADAP